jgi:hypothetical protein
MNDIGREKIERLLRIEKLRMIIFLKNQKFTGLSLIWKERPFQPEILKRNIRS